MQRVRGGRASSGFPEEPEDLLGSRALGSRAVGQQWGWCVERCREQGVSGLEGSVLTWPRHLQPQGPLAFGSVPRLLHCLNRRSLNSRSLLFLELQLLEAEQEMRLKGSGSPAPLPCPPADLVTGVCLRWELGLPCTGWAAASQAGCASAAFRSWPCCPKLLWLKATA